AAPWLENGGEGLASRKGRRNRRNGRINIFRRAPCCADPSSVGLRPTPSPARGEGTGCSPQWATITCRKTEVVSPLRNRSLVRPPSRAASEGKRRRAEGGSWIFDTSH